MYMYAKGLYCKDFSCVCFEVSMKATCTYVQGGVALLQVSSHHLKLLVYSCNSIFSKTKFDFSVLHLPENWYVCHWLIKRLHSISYSHISVQMEYTCRSCLWLAIVVQLTMCSGPCA